MNEPIDWQARKQRALAHTKRLVEEWERARGKKVPPRWIEYRYDTDLCDEETEDETMPCMR